MAPSMSRAAAKSKAAPEIPHAFRFRCACKGCKRSVKGFDLNYETPKSDGWGFLHDAGAIPRDSIALCPLHNMLVRENLEEGKVYDPARERVESASLAHRVRLRSTSPTVRR